MSKIRHQSDYDFHAPSPNELKNGELKPGDLITNIYSGAVWVASESDCVIIKPETYDTHKKYRKMLPLI